MFLFRAITLIDQFNQAARMHGEHHAPIDRLDQKHAAPGNVEIDWRRRLANARQPPRELRRGSAAYAIALEERFSIGLLRCIYRKDAVAG